MKIAFWNINMGDSSFNDKKDTFENWCAQIAPDLLFLEEVGYTLTQETLEELTGMRMLNFVNTLDRYGQNSTKRLWAFQREELGFMSTVLRFPNLEERRALLKTTHREIRNFELWVIHANASQTGGQDAVAAVNNYIITNDWALVGGDFNFPIQNAGANITSPLNWNATPYHFTQWNKVDGRTDSPNEELQITSEKRNPIIYRQVNPHNIIDYVISGNEIQSLLSAIPSIPTEDMWIDILRNFDHAPVVYNLDFDKITRKKCKHLLSTITNTADSIADISAITKKLKANSTLSSNSIATINTNLELASIIPSIPKEEVNNLKNTFKNIKTKLDDFINKAKPFFDFCELHDEQFQLFSKNCNKAVHLLEDTNTMLLFAAQTIHDSNSNKIVIEIGSDDFDVLLNNLELADNLFQKMPDLKLLSQYLNSLTSQLDDINDVLTQMIKPLNDIAKLMDKKFGFSFKYPAPTLTNLLRMKTADVSISFSIIIKGPEAIENEIERILGKTVWNALKTIGVEKFVKQLENDANNALNEILKDIDFQTKIELSIPDFGESFEAFVLCENLVLATIEIKFL